MRPEGEIRAAMQTLAQFSMKCRKGSAEWIQLVGQAGVLGWVLGDDQYSKHIDELLKELRKMLKEPETNTGG